MKRLSFDDLKRLPVLPCYEAAFSKATGVSLKLVPPDDPRQYVSCGPSENAFCVLMTRIAAGCEACLETHMRAQQGIARHLVPQQVYCFAGLHVAAVPVVISGQHAATFLSGQVFRRPPTQHDFLRVVERTMGGMDSEQKEQVRKAYFETPVVTADRFQAIIYLLNVFAQYLADYAVRCAIACAGEEAGPVAIAKQYVQCHIEQPFRVKEVLARVHLSKFYFCKLFKKSTGMTLTEYVTRVRVEKAKALLVDPSLRITEVVYAAGFGSIPHFNSVFRSYVGMAPTQYRATLRVQLFSKPAA